MGEPDGPCLFNVSDPCFRQASQTSGPVPFQSAFPIHRLAVTSLLCATPSQVIETQTGKIQGKTYKFPGCPQVDCYLGIPYGQPPVGELRFKKPLPAIKWEGIRDCSKFGPRAPQIDFMDAERPASVDEDCLNLNVFVPSGDKFEAYDNSSRGRPVLVFIHGGGYAFHSASDYGDKGMCTTICRKGVIVVTIQYRLAFLGFLTTGDSVAPGNFGLFDQALALKWVKENIEAFGGDSDNVTVSGQSAGGSSCDLLSISPVSRDLFQKVLPLGGNAECSFAMDTTENVAAACRTFTKEMGWEEDSKLASISAQNVSLVAFLRGLPSQDLALGMLGKPGFEINQKKLELVPVYDGEFLPKPLDELRKEAPKKTCMIGATEFEGLFFVTVKQLPATEEFMERAIRSGLAIHDHEEDEDIKKVVEEIKSAFWRREEDDEKRKMRALCRIIGDITILASLPTYTSKMTLAGHTVYLFSFDYARSGRLGLGHLMPFLAATHCSELPYLFGKGPFYEFDPDEEDKVVIEQFTTLVANFCRYGNPNGLEGDSWKEATPENPFAYFSVNENCEMKENYQERRSKLWIEGLRKVKEIRGRNKARI
ncbi:hypothetical protein L596_012781 [Steinernema carpocapsae]|uniref:Carboxylic ester hydrolase n=1 Tax=Steinernema carpocapsae TaxID=34508 RepID=A0A4U5NYA0_STECR|nr:hypothetical protein L596_012781 [Steinernema carpocapsae]